MTCAADNYRDRHEHFTGRSAAEREVLFYEASVGALENAATSGSLVVCDLVYAELCTYFSSQRECDAFLEGNEIRVEPLSREALFLASRTWRTYHKQGGQRTRILVDFLIGAHAQTQATRLVSRDRGSYRKLFPSWRVACGAVTPSRRLASSGIFPRCMAAGAVSWLSTKSKACRSATPDSRRASMSMTFR